MANAWVQVPSPDSKESLHRYIDDVISVLSGRSGRAIPITLRNDAGTTIFSTTLSGAAAGVQVSPSGSGVAAGNYLIYPKMRVYFEGTAAQVPTGWSIVTASKNAFVYGANADGDVSTTGGTSSHAHTLSAHTHTEAHTHTITTQMWSHTHDVDHNHGNKTSTAPSNTTNALAGAGVSPGAGDHTHDVNPDALGATDSGAANTAGGAPTNASGAASNANTGVPSIDSTDTLSHLPVYVRYYLIGIG